MAKPELPFPDVTQLLSQFRLPGVDVGAVMESRRKDIEAVMAANRHAYEGMQQLAQRQAEMFKEALSEWQSATQDMMSAPSSAAGTTKQVEFGKQALAKVLENMRELAEMAARSQTEAFEVVNRRFHESLDELKSSMQQK
jgi:phasin family protein